MLSYISKPEIRQYAAVVTANLTILHLGMHIAWASPMLIKFRDPDQNVIGRPLSDTEEAWIASVHQLAASAVLLTTGTLLSWFGRHRMILIMFIPRIVMCFLLIFATETWMIYLGRCIGGTADSMCLSAASTYASEIAGKKNRGASGTVTQILSATGMMIMFSVGPYASYLGTNVMMACIVVVTYIPILFIPESPYFLYSKGRTQDAIEILTLLRGNEEEAYAEIKEYASIPENKKGVDTKSLFKDKVVIKTFILSILLALSFALNGYSAVYSYLQIIFESAQTNLSSEISSLIIGVIQLIAGCTTFLMTDRFGRKPILCVSLVGLAFGMIGLGTFFVILESGREIVGFLNYLPLISIAFVIYGYNAGLGSLVWMVVAELFEGSVRPYGLSCAMFTGVSGGFAITFTFPLLVNSIGPSAMYYIFSGISVLVSVFIYFCIPETKGRSFAEIQTALGRKNVEAVDKGKA